MITFAQDLNSDLSQQSSQSATVSGGEFNEQLSILNGIAMESVVNSVNMFVLCWSIFYSVICLTQFFEYRIFYGGGEYTNEKNGMDGINRALQIWWKFWFYQFFYITFVLFKNSPASLFLAIVSLMMAFIKLYLDSISILELLNYFAWSRDFVSKLKSAMGMKS